MMSTDPYALIAEEARKGTMGPLGAGTVAYVSRGGTYLIASAPNWNDSGEARDLVAILPMAAERGGSRVVVLRPTVNPELVDALRAVLDD